MYVNRYFLLGLVSGILAVVFLILDIKTYLDYADWLIYCKACFIFNPAPNLIKLFIMASVVFSSMSSTFLIIHFKKWNETSKFHTENYSTLNLR